MAPEKHSCSGKHLLLLAGFAALLVGLALTLVGMQTASAEKHDARIRVVEQFRAETIARDRAVTETLIEIKADIKEIKQAVKSKP